MALFGNLFGAAQPQKQKFQRVLSTSDFLSADVAVSASKWNVVASYVVPAQQEITWGSNDPTGGASIAGSAALVKFADTSSAAMTGKIRLALSNANQTNTVVVIERDTGSFAASATDRTTAVLIPEYPIRAKEDSLLQILFNPDSSATIDYDDAGTSIALPVTVYQ